jgi:hypothetical protein
MEVVEVAAYDQKTPKKKKKERKEKQVEAGRGD